ncbi:DUF397 domain-containing protein [Actinacidiphila sp. ITFR-21]|uniref:DUF397 domain-containing protein n=1 Tax=Actinacidiphila sp. ITFR-21 TaxID=3075199 RepID=UPI00288A2B37|nr:DUF397 domain-containing protein [Streptomyces sp. ITFR-21]WNI15347.1 DUF397 domain-containing protein [Streptomyces sp. ITFR-21]
MNIAVDLNGAQWRKSTYSGMENNCLEVAPVEGHVATRDSKDPAGPALVFSQEAWTAFVCGVTAGEFGAA